MPETNSRWLFPICIGKIHYSRDSVIMWFFSSLNYCSDGVFQDPLKLTLMPLWKLICQFFIQSLGKFGEITDVVNQVCRPWEWFFFWKLNQKNKVSWVFFLLIINPLKRLWLVHYWRWRPQSLQISVCCSLLWCKDISLFWCYCNDR